ncbi:MAG: hypothetical protein JNN20_19155, partial [Betaproteobacteria bacterium]|nr:hypothetical protein [Betaproteobacteria bacterium]
MLQVLLFIGMSTIAVVCHAAPSLAWKTSVYSTGDADAIPGGDLTGRARKAMAIDSVGNVYVFGSSGVGGVTIKYSPNGAKLWEIVRKNFTPVAIVLDPAGDIYATGSNHNGSNFDYVTAKFNSSGVEQWRQVANGANNRDDQALAIALDINGNVIVTGKSQNANPTSRALDFLTIKYSAAGIEQWRAVANGSGDFNDTAYAVAADVDGSVVVTGRGASTNDDYLTIKYNAMGVEQWRAVMNGNPSGYQYDVPSAMVMDAGGNIYVTGTSGNTAGTTDYLTVKYDSAGTEIWRRSLNSNLGGSEAFALALAPDGDVVVTGYGGTAGGSEYMTIRYASDGTEKWRVAMDPGPNRIAAGYSIVIGSDNSTYVTGVALIGPNYDYVTVKYNAAGTELWRTASQGGPDTQDYSYLLSLDGDGNVIVGGYSTARNYNFLIVKLDANGAELWRGREGRLNGLESTLGSGYSARQAMTTDAARNSYITGSAANGEAPLSTEYLTVKLGPDGEEVWRVQTA